MFTYRFKHGKNRITVDSFKATKAEAHQDITDYMDSAFPAIAAPKAYQIVEVVGA